MKKIIKMMKKQLNKSFFAIYFATKYQVKKNNRRKKDLANKEYILINEYKKYYGRNPNLSPPLYFSEKLLYLKLHYNNPRCTILSDKNAAKLEVAKIIGKDISPKTLQTFKTPDNLDFTGLPKKFVLKLNHVSGFVFLAEEKKGKFYFTDLKDNERKIYNKREIKRLLRLGFKIDWSLSKFEWNYRGIKPMVVVEEYLGDFGDVIDYKFFINYGELIYFYLVFGRQSSPNSNYYDANKRFVPVVAASPPNQNAVTLPHNIDLMIEYAKKIGSEFPLCRVDLYNYKGDIMFGEVTFFHQGGEVEYYYPDNFDQTFGSKIKL